MVCTLSPFNIAYSHCSAKNKCIGEGSRPKISLKGRYINERPSLVVESSSLVRSIDSILETNCWHRRNRCQCHRRRCQLGGVVKTLTLLGASVSMKAAAAAAAECRMPANRLLSFDGESADSTFFLFQNLQSRNSFGVEDNCFAFYEDSITWFSWGSGWVSWVRSGLKQRRSAAIR